MNLYDHQLRANRQVWKHHETNAQSVLLQASTGAGKSVAAAHMAKMRYVHKGQTTHTPLPATASSLPSIERVPLGCMSLAYKLPLASSEPDALQGSSSVPWSAPQLKPGSRVLCRTCGACLVEAHTITVSSAVSHSVDTTRHALWLTT